MVFDRISIQQSKPLTMTIDTPGIQVSKIRLKAALAQGGRYHMQIVFYTVPP